MDKFKMWPGTINHAPGDVVDIQVKRRTSQDETETLELSATLGSNDTGDAYLGIAYLPLGARLQAIQNRMDRPRQTMPYWGADRGNPEVPEAESEDSENDAEDDAEPMSL